MRDVLLVSLGGTAGLREADAELAASLERAGASVEVAAVPRVREWRTMAAIEERDGVRFYIDRTSPLQPIRLVRTPGFGGSYLKHP